MDTLLSNETNNLLSLNILCDIDSNEKLFREVDTMTIIEKTANFVALYYNEHIFICDLKNNNLCKLDVKTNIPSYNCFQLNVFKKITAIFKLKYPDTKLFNYYQHNNIRIIFSCYHIYIFNLEITKNGVIHSFNIYNAFFNNKYIADNQHIYDYINNKLYKIKMPINYKLERILDINDTVLCLDIINNINETKIVFAKSTSFF